MKTITLSTPILGTMVLGLALALGACASEPAAPEAAPAATSAASEQAAAEEAKANEAREIAMAQQAQREAAEKQAADQKAAADKAAADKAAKDKAAAEAAATKAAADKAAADKLAAETAATTKPAAKEQQPVVNPPLADTNVVAELETSAGTMVLGFFPDKAPNHVKNFVELSRKGFYDGTLFHRVINHFMIQGGDPNSKDPAKSAMWGAGGPGYKINNEFNDTKHVRGILSMARSGGDVNSAGSQFFICHATAPHLDHQYTAFGELLKGYDVLDKIATAPPVPGTDRPKDPVKLIKVTIRPRTPADVKSDG